MANIGRQVVKKAIIDLQSATYLRVRAIASSRKSINRRWVNPLLLQGGQNHIPPKRNLIRNIRELEKNRRIMKKILLENRCLIPKQAQLG